MFDITPDETAPAGTPEGERPAFCIDSPDKADWLLRKLHAIDAEKAPAREVLDPECQHPVDRHALHRGVAAEVLLDELTREPVDPGRDGSVRGEDRAGPRDLQGRVEGRPRPGQLPDALDAEETGVTLVGVEHRGLRAGADARVRTQRAHAADAQQHLLQQPVLGAATVEPVGHVEPELGVVADVGVE